MNTLVTVTQVLMGLVITGFVILPWVRPTVEPEAEFPQRPEVIKEFDKEAILDTLRDLEYELETGRINGRAYRRIRERYVNRALELMDEDELEEEITSRSREPADRNESLEEEIASVREELNDQEGT